MNRRNALRQTLLAAGSLAALSAHAQDSCAVQTPATLATVTPDSALQRLTQGNERFVSGRTVNCDLIKQVKATSGHQSPFAAVLGCMDSRVPPELVFDQRIGDLFVARVAGNVSNDDIVGSLEYATRVAGSKLVVVLGHGDCGAVKGAIDDVMLGSLTGLLAKIRPAMKEIDYKAVPASKDKELVRKVTTRNVQDTAAALLAKSPLMADMVKSGQLRIVGAMHDVSTGQVHWL